jgi:lipopolysaccharide cholinephosphotransferase
MQYYMSWVILTVIILLLLAICCLFKLENWTHADHHKNSKNEKYTNLSDIKTDEKILTTIRTMLRDIDTLLTNNSITYWIDGGTLLGAIRHKDVIPWDDDADIVVLESDKDKLLDLTQRLNGMGYGLVSFWGGYKIFPLNGVDIKYYNRNWQWNQDSKDIKDSETFNYKFPFIDVFFAKEFDDMYHFSDDKVRRVWPSYYHETNDLFPLKRYQFNDFALTGPNNPTPYLDKAYGKDWPTIAYKQYDHENQKILDKQKFNIKDLSK